MSLLAVSTVSHSAPSSVLPYVLIVGGAIVGFVVLVAAVAAAVNAREARLHGRGDSYSVPDHDHPRGSDGGMSYRPWEQTYQRRGYQPEAELAAAESASAERSAATAGRVVAGASTPIGAPGSAPKGS